MSTLYVNAPTQNKEFNPDMQLGKVVPFFVARAMADQELPRIDLWNNVLASEQADYTPEEYGLIAQKRLVAKYSSNVFQWLETETTAPQIVTDTDSSFQEWTEARITQSLSDGDMALQRLSVFICNQCDATISPAEGPRPNCITCPTAQIQTAARLALTATITPSTIQAVWAMVGEKCPPPSHPRVIQLATGITTLNKRRHGGVSLKQFGLEGDKLDARVGVGLLALYAAEVSEATGVRLIASKTTQLNNLPQFAAAVYNQLAVLPEFGMAGIPKAPVNYLRSLVETDILDEAALYEGLLTKIAPALPGMSQDMSPATAERILFSRKRPISIV